MHRSSQFACAIVAILAASSAHSAVAPIEGAFSADEALLNLPSDVAHTSALVQARGAIRGRLDIRSIARPIERRPEVSESGSVVREAVDLRRGVVYLESAPRGAFEERETVRAVLDQRNETFVPHVLPIMVGTVVDFPNSDRTYHNVFSLSKAKRFDLGRYAAGRSKSVRFDRPGVVRVFCDIHSHMNAFVLVFTHPFFALTDLDGRFRLENVPAGTYTVIAWYEGEARSSRSVTVPSGGVVDVELVVQ
jgi:plastocyanin